MATTHKLVSEKKRLDNSKFPYKLSMRMSESAYNSFNNWYLSNRLESLAHAFRAILDVLPSGHTPLTLVQIKKVADAANSVRATNENPTVRWNPNTSLKKVLRLRPQVSEAQHLKLTAVFTQMADHCKTENQAPLSDGAIAYGLMIVFGETAVNALKQAQPAAGEAVSTPQAKKPAARRPASTTAH